MLRYQNELPNDIVKFLFIFNYFSLLCEANQNTN